jgi:hypothetical protein
MINPYKPQQNEINEEEKKPRMRKSTIALIVLWGGWALAPEMNGCMKKIKNKFNNPNNPANVAPDNAPKMPQP